MLAEAQFPGPGADGVDDALLGAWLPQVAPTDVAQPELLEDAPLQHRCILWQRCAKKLLAFRLHRLEGGQKVLLHRVLVERIQRSACHDNPQAF